MEEKQTTKSYLQRLKQQTSTDIPYGGEAQESGPGMGAVNCPSCGAARAKTDGIKRCAYCGYDFLQVDLTDGLFLKKEDS